MRFHPWILSIFVASSTLVFQNQAVAEDAEASGPIEEVLVTARRREESVTKTYRFPLRRCRKISWRNVILSRLKTFHG